MENPKKPSGLLNVKTGRDHFKLNLYAPSSDLEPFVEHYWIVHWDLRGQEPYLSENLPHPAVHLSIEPNQCRIVGIVKEKFSISIKEKDFVFGIKFRPGAFYPFVRIPVSEFTGRSVPAQDIFGADMTALEEAIRSLNDEKEMVKQGESFLLNRLPEKDETLLLIHTMMDSIQTDREITTVDDMASRFHLSERTLQRIFNKYVGVSPKWVIRRYRLLDLADELAKGHPQSWPQLSADLGYYDQSHLIKDFKRSSASPPMIM